MEKCIGWFLVYPFLGGFLLKVQKGCAYVIMLKIALVLVKNMFFGLKKDISGLWHWVAQKAYCYLTPTQYCRILEE